MAEALRRPQSQGSTASIHSISTQPNIEQSFTESRQLYTGSWLPNDHGHAREVGSAHSQMTPSPEEILLATMSMQAPVGASMQNVSYHAGHSLSRQSMSVDSFAGNTSFADDSQMFDRDNGDSQDANLESFVAGSGKTKSGSRSSANNELEMRQLFNANKHRSLPDVARELMGNDRGPNSERTRQVFAMLWISQVCSVGKGSVPRGRVYAHYAHRCATERITVLNPASFGKLVRVLFPGLRTRRLGVRGESKYHYTNFALAEDQLEFRDPGDMPQDEQKPPLGDHSLLQDFNTTLNSPAAMEPEHAAPAAREAGQLVDAPVEKKRYEFLHCLYNQTQPSTVDQLNNSTGKTAQKLHFLPDSPQSFKQSDPLLLPQIEPFLPNGTDPDAAKSLTALYRSHCTSLVECIRFCKDKAFFHLFTSFQGTLTMPVQKLFTNPAVAAWIEECDFVLYQRMMRIVSSLTLQVVPKPVLEFLRKISERLVPHIRESFRGLPQHVIKAKEAPAIIFAGLLDRALRVNLAAHAAANMLSNPANRDLMYLEWISMINLRKIAESIPSRGMDDVVNVLLNEMRGLLNPVEVPWDIECLTLYGEITLRKGPQQHEEQDEEQTASNVLDPWVKFLKGLSERFPYATATDIVWCVQRLGTTVMRDITIAQGKSFGSWWVTKCFVDEMIQFLAEQGGFMTQKSTQDPLHVSKRQSAKKVTSNAGSRYSSASEDFNLSRMSEMQPDRAPFPSTSQGTTQQSNPDDSGIGIRTPDEDLPTEKYFSAAHLSDLFAGT
ncbi:transcriptional regulator RFX1 [Echria macrotheca]|uniref:Transcriptional regulator RFX1 n=1 Tax=Echria macrotheca TaxID=438768 RepID=A0AAJ0BMB1_9PEZI|nr:transcriptional regulator RFX1 [Echria macrotheca]